MKNIMLNRTISLSIDKTKIIATQPKSQVYCDQWSYNLMSGKNQG